MSTRQDMMASKTVTRSFSFLSTFVLFISSEKLMWTKLITVFYFNVMYFHVLQKANDSQDRRAFKDCSIKYQMNLIHYQNITHKHIGVLIKRPG